jgi:hypothetical protein
MKRTISIELWEDGNRTFLGEVPITKAFSDSLHLLECDKPNRLRESLKKAVSYLWNLAPKVKGE